jgi:hypothetical protein
MILNFLKTGRDKAQLRVALEVIREFKAHESIEEYGMTPFMAWAKLEQLEEYLAHLVEDAPLEADTLRALAHIGEG